MWKILERNGNVKEIYEKWTDHVYFLVSGDFRDGILRPFDRLKAQDRLGSSPTRPMILPARRNNPLWLSLFPLPLSPAPRVRMGRIKKLYVRVLEEPDQKNAGQEPADMRKKRHAAAFGAEAHAPAQNLHHKPQAQHD